MYKENDLKKKMIRKYGQTAGTPLFDSILPTSNLPDWIWDGTEVKAEAYNSLSKKYTDLNKVKYITTSIKLGGAATDNEIKDNSDLPINIITARRKDLIKEGVVSGFKDKKKPGPSGKLNTIWYLNFKALHQIIY